MQSKQILNPQISLSKLKKPSEIMRNCKLKQCRTVLKRGYSYCFLGALYTELGGNADINENGSYNEVCNFLAKYGIDCEVRNRILNMNDGKELSFTQIADYIADRYDL